MHGAETNEQSVEEMVATLEKENPNDVLLKGLYNKVESTKVASKRKNLKKQISQPKRQTNEAFIVSAAEKLGLTVKDQVAKKLGISKKSITSVEKSTDPRRKNTWFADVNGKRKTATLN